MGIKVLLLKQMTQNLEQQWIEGRGAFGEPVVELPDSSWRGIDPNPQSGSSPARSGQQAIIIAQAKLQSPNK